MRVRMKLVVPLTMPVTRRIFSPASDSRSGRMSGMPPATDASKSRSTPGALRGLEQLGADVREQLLVGGDDRLARASAVEDERAGRLDAADHLDDDVDGRIGDDRGRVGGEHALRQRDRTVLRDVAHRDPLDPQRRHRRASRSSSPFSAISPTSAPPTLPKPRMPTPMLLLVPRPAHGAHSSSRARRSSSVSRRTTTRAAPSRTNTTAGRVTRL